MTVLARKVSRAKWEPRGEGDDAIRADAVTELRTTNDTLSFWHCESKERHHLERAVLALAAANDKPDKIDVVFLEEAAIDSKAIERRHTPGDTPVESLREHHVDLEKLDLTSLCSVATLIADACRGTAWHRVTRSDVLNLVAKAVSDGRVTLEALKPGMQEEVRKKLQR